MYFIFMLYINFKFVYQARYNRSKSSYTGWTNVVSVSPLGLTVAKRTVKCRSTESNLVSNSATAFGRCTRFAAEMANWRSVLPLFWSLASSPPLHRLRQECRGRTTRINHLRWQLIADRNEWPKPYTIIIRRFLFKLVGMISLDGN